MKLVRENINFERGLDPKIAMGIGITKKNIVDFFNKVNNTRNDFCWWLAMEFCIKYKKYDFLKFCLTHCSFNDKKIALSYAIHDNNLKATRIILKYGNIKIIDAIDLDHLKILRQWRDLSPTLYKLIYKAFGKKYKKTIRK